MVLPPERGDSTMCSRVRSVLLAGIVASLAVSGSVDAQEYERRDESIRGRVRTDAGLPIPGAEIIVTMAPERETFRTITDSSGLYALRVAQGTGDYLVYIAAVGRTAVRKRVLREGSETTFTVDAELRSAVQQLPTVRVAVRPRRPLPTDPFSRDRGGAERATDGLSNALSPSDQGDLSALAATVPGMALTPDGLSTLGLGQGHVQTTLGGLSFAGTALPRNAPTLARVARSAYDPARGNFSGAELALELQPGGIFTYTQAHVTIEPDVGGDAVRASDAQARRVGTALGGTGELVENKVYFNFGGDFRYRAAPAHSLLDLDRQQLRDIGVALDSVNRLLELLQAAAPQFASGVGTAERRDTQLRGSLRLDHRRVDSARFPIATWSLTGVANHSRSALVGMTPTATPASSATSTSRLGVLQVVRSRYSGLKLHETRFGITNDYQNTRPYLTLPGGRVLLSSTFNDAPDAVTPIAFGGSSALMNETRLWTWEGIHETQFYNRGGRGPHRIKLYAQSRFDDYSAERPADLFGTFSYQSLADFAANRPSGFTRTLTSPAYGSRLWTGAAAVGDEWRRSQTLTLQYGIRLDGSAFLTDPPRNRNVEDAFGVRSDIVPNGIFLSPRFGFRWAVRPRGTDSRMVTNLGTVHRTPTGVLRGGAGAFRNRVPPTAIGDAMIHSGNGRRIACFGVSTPTPNWSVYPAGVPAPTECAEGASDLADVAPAIHLLDPGFTAPTSWRANLEWTARIKRVHMSIEGIHSTTVNMPSFVDLNFAGVPRFVIEEEGARPVYVSAASIVPSSGLVSPVDGRRNEEFGHVWNRKADNRVSSQQLTLVATPEISGRYFLRAGYTLNRSRERTRGYDATTFGDPREARSSWAALDQRHLFHLESGVHTPWFLLTAFTRVGSGFPFTPRIRGDINGDGLTFNDRPFIFEPGTSAGSVNAGLAELLTSGPRRARDCLRAYIGGVVPQGVCRGPWSGAMNAYLTLQPQVSERLLRTREATVNLAFHNVLEGIDRLLHGRAVRGWGALAQPDPVLYTVRGFNPEANQFAYVVNQRFGSVRPHGGNIFSGFRVAIDIRIGMNRPLPEQQLNRWLAPGRIRPGTMLGVDSLKARYSRNVPDLYASILQLSDSLLLSRSQADLLAAAQVGYRARLDSLWAALATDLAALGSDFDAREAIRRQERGIDDAWELSRLEAKALDRILSPIQLRLLPWPSNLLYHAREPVRVRVFMN
ncbi:hypothetical protein BH23GEM2_BH23GEM2_19330 [soil metagenome]